MFDDPITQKYYDDLESNFKIIDEDADFAPHNFEQQKHLQEFLENAKRKIEAATTPENQHETEEIVKNINEAKDKVSKSTKAENVNRVRKIIAKAYKLRYDIGKELLLEFTADAVKFAIGTAIGALLG